MRERRLSNVRPTYLLVEPAGGPSSRKLVLETALEHNVLLANSADEAQTTVHVFPNVDGVIVHGALRESFRLVSWLRKKYPEKYIIFLAEPTGRSCSEADIVISGHDPAHILAALADHYGAHISGERRTALLDDLVRTLRRIQIPPRSKIHAARRTSQRAPRIGKVIEKKNSVKKLPQGECDNEDNRQSITADSTQLRSRFSD